jgi:hypothetical protein
MGTVTEFFRNIAEAYGGLGVTLRIVIIVVIAVVTSVAGVAVLVRLPSNHFLDRTAPPPLTIWRRHPALRITLLVLKNLLGIVVLPLGIVMSLPLVPGPGLVFILLGLSLLDFPGKRALERSLIRRPFVLRMLNNMRFKFGRPPFEVPD